MTDAEMGGTPSATTGAGADSVHAIPIDGGPHRLPGLDEEGVPKGTPRAVPVEQKFMFVLCADCVSRLPPVFLDGTDGK